jgi:hypothetical protein
LKYTYIWRTRHDLDVGRVGLIERVVVVLAEFIVAAGDCFRHFFTTHEVRKLLFLVKFLVVLPHEGAPLAIGGEGKEELDGVDGAHAGDFETFLVITEEHLDGSEVFMAKVDVALVATTLLRHTTHLLEEFDDKVTFLPAVADPTDVTHVTALVLVARGVGANSVDPTDDSPDDWQRVLAELLLCRHQETLVVDEARIALEMDAIQAVVALQRL